MSALETGLLSESSREDDPCWKVCFKTREEWEHQKRVGWCLLAVCLVGGLVYFIYAFAVLYSRVHSLDDKLQVFNRQLVDIVFDLRRLCERAEGACEYYNRS